MGQNQRKKNIIGKFKSGRRRVNMECVFIEEQNYCEIERNHLKNPEIKKAKKY